MHFTKQLKITSLTIVILLLSACHHSYNLTTNIDKDNFKTYFSASQVHIYPNEQAIKTNYRLIGLVEGEDCQKKSHHAQPSKVNARTDARKKAYQRQANGIIFTSCVIIPTVKPINKKAPACIATQVCYAKAYQISSSALKED